MSNNTISIETNPNIDFFSGLWNGFGSVIILQTGATLNFILKKIIKPIDNNIIKINQVIEIQEIEDIWNLDFIIYDMQEDKFSIELNSDKIFNLKGNGTFSTNYVDWKFYDEEGKIMGKALFTRIKENTFLINSTYKFPGKAQISISGVLNRSSENY